MAYGNPYFQQYQQPTYQGQFNRQMDFMPQQGLRGRQVSSIDEAKAAQIDFDGSVFYFPDLAHNKIYTKQVMMDGTASLLTYAIVQENKQEAPEYVTKEEFNNTISELKTALKGASNVQCKPASKSNDVVPAF